MPMSDRIKCFMLQPTNRARRWLRRYYSAERPDGMRLCEPNGYHNAMALIDDADLIRTERGGHSLDSLTWPEDDPRWPEKCDHCDYRFHEKETRQLFYVPIYLTPDGKEVTIRSSGLPGLDSAPPGSMWYADWLSCWKGPDQRSLVLMTPGGEWCIDSPASNGPGWTRTGTPPIVTARPSIICGGYHGWLTDGELVRC